MWTPSIGLIETTQKNQSFWNHPSFSAFPPSLFPKGIWMLSLQFWRSHILQFLRRLAGLHYLEVDSWKQQRAEKCCCCCCCCLLAEMKSWRTPPLNISVGEKSSEILSPNLTDQPFGTMKSRFRSPCFPTSFVSIDISAYPTNVCHIYENTTRFFLLSLITFIWYLPKVFQWLAHLACRKCHLWVFIFGPPRLHLLRASRAL